MSLQPEPNYCQLIMFRFLALKNICQPYKGGRLRHPGQPNSGQGVDYKMKFKRLELRLPEDHEIFSYPSGTRSTMATVFLDIGMKLSHIENKLDNLEHYINDIRFNNGQTQITGPITEDKTKIAKNLIEGFGID